MGFRRQGHRGGGPRLALVGALVLAGCGTGTPAPNDSAASPAATPATITSSPARSASASPTPALVLAAFGDSITAPPGGTCPGCTPYVDRYAEALSVATGLPVSIRNLARPGLRVEVLAQELVSGALQDAAASADVIIVGVGNSDAPWNIADDACDGPATAVELVPWERYSDECIATEVERFRPAFEALFERVAELRAGQPTVLRAINRYNDWIGFEGGVVPPEAVEISVAYNVAWNGMICESAEAAGFACGDVSRAFNGADGRSASGDLLAADYLHPSDKGYERIAQVLVDLGFAPLVP